jgi:hypothetical protein
VSPSWVVGEGYAYLWYYAPDYYYASGRGGQYVFVFPDDGLVIGLINLWKWDLEFDGDTVTFYLESLAGGELPATVTGTMVP